MKALTEQAEKQINNMTKRELKELVRLFVMYNFPNSKN